ncbi:unnamed protein product [Blepharisma stoltei]|uniref:Uncharacterized protein n=1 Tax=Blepharisma stoltei TaxID=1481888 RepID=A0AAU9K8W3_9CILI|nr:unnamed protein product [Blepharisma stoltei]
MDKAPTILKPSFHKPNKSMDIFSPTRSVIERRKPSLTGDAKKCYMMVENVEKMVDDYCYTSISQENKTVGNRKMLREDIFVAPCLKTAVETLKKRMKIYENIKPEKPVMYPIPRRFRSESMTDEKIGPGCYETADKNNALSYEFPLTTRMEDPVYHQLSTLKGHRRSETPGKHIIRKNKFLDGYRHCIRNQLIQIKAGDHNRKVVSVMDSVRELNKSAQSLRREKLENKLRKDNWNKNKAEFIEIRRNWIQLIFLFGFMSCSRWKIYNKKKLHERAYKAIEWLYSFSLTIGKFRIILKNVRKKISHKKVSCLANLIVSFSLSKRTEMAQKVCKASEDILEMDLLFLCMSKWLRSIYFVQRKIRRFLQIKRARVEAIYLMWDKQVELMAKSPSRSSNKRAAASRSTDTSQKTVKDILHPKLKENFIKVFLVDKLSEFVNLQNAYKIQQECGKVTKSKEIEFWESESDVDKEEIKIIDKPKFELFREPESLQKYIAKAREENLKQMMVTQRTEFRRKTVKK